MSPISDHSTDGPGGGEPQRQARNHDTLVRFGILLAAAAFIASTVPGVLFAATFSSFLFVFSLGSAIAGALAREPMGAGHLTRWDQAAALMALSILAKLFVDPEVLRQASSGAL